VRLTKHSDYALRVLVYLAADAGRQASSEAVSAAYGISAHHLVKVIGTLGKAGFLTIKRGRAGGFTLARDPAEIRIGDVIEATEPDFAFVECLEPGNHACALTGTCGLIPPLQAARKAFIAALNEYTLADVVGARAPRYRKLLAIL
jgi:Rrf2 family transcriptional regulator, nitric oxide-sensitive transcriptional repressor